MNREVRMGIDVGGTHTKAVAIDNSTHEIIGESIVKTTHDDKMGVAAGVIECFKECLQKNDISPKEVVFIAHSTTQATNALIEGDVAKVGIIGMGKGGIEGILAKKQTHIPDIDLGAGRFIRFEHTYINTKNLTEDVVEKEIEGLLSNGAKVIVASKAFGVDSILEEDMVRRVAEKHEIPVSVASEISKLYGLTRRTRTASINASILPKMLNTANSTESSVRSVGIEVPLMIMRGDGGVMELNEMRKRPVLTMLSGPAASVVGALMYLRASNGIYFEVGGTTTNIGVIKNGRPAVEYSIVGGHRTFISSLDVRVLGVAGGSMVRASNHKLVDVGPRSAHIAGTDYSVYSENIEDPELEFFSPRQGDPGDYVCVKLKDGRHVTITNSCAANVLGLVNPEDYSYGNIDSARKAMKPLADYLGVSVEKCAEMILEKSYEKIEPVILELVEKYNLEKSQNTLVALGGGASSLIPFSAKRLGMPYDIPEHAEVISSIGVALAMVRDVVERVLPNPTTEDIVALKKEARMMAIKSGAVPESVVVQIEVDSQSSKVTAIAMGSTEVRTTDLLKACDEDEMKSIAAKSMGVSADEVHTLEHDDMFYIFGHKKADAQIIRLIDKKGFVRIQRGDAMVVKCPASSWKETVTKVWNEMLSYKGELVSTPDFYMCKEGSILDYMGVVSLEQLMTIMNSEFIGISEEEDIILIGARN